MVVADNYGRRYQWMASMENWKNKRSTEKHIPWGGLTFMHATKGKKDKEKDDENQPPFLSRLPLTLPLFSLFSPTCATRQSEI